MQRSRRGSRQRRDSHTSIPACTLSFTGERGCAPDRRFVRAVVVRARRPVRNEGAALRRHLRAWPAGRGGGGGYRTVGKYKCRPLCSGVSHMCPWGPTRKPPSCGNTLQQQRPLVGCRRRRVRQEGQAHRSVARGQEDLIAAGCVLLARVVSHHPRRAVKRLQGAGGRASAARACVRLGWTKLAGSGAGAGRNRAGSCHVRATSVGMASCWYCWQLGRCCVACQRQGITCPHHYLQVLAAHTHADLLQQPPAQTEVFEAHQDGRGARRRLDSGRELLRGVGGGVGGNDAGLAKRGLRQGGGVRGGCWGYTTVLRLRGGAVGWMWVCRQALALAGQPAGRRAGPARSSD